MVEISKEELEKLESKLSDMENIINGIEGQDGLELYYSTCTHQHKRLRRLLNDLTMKYNELYDWFDKWYSDKSIDNQKET